MSFRINSGIGLVLFSGSYYNCNAPQARHRRPPLTGSGTGGLKGRKQGRENNGICAGPDMRLYCAPRGASTVLVVDPKTDKLSFIRRPKDGQAKLH